MVLVLCTTTLGCWCDGHVMSKRHHSQSKNGCIHRWIYIYTRTEFRSSHSSFGDGGSAFIVAVAAQRVKPSNSAHEIQFVNMKFMDLMGNCFSFDSLLSFVFSKTISVVFVWCMFTCLCLLCAGHIAQTPCPKYIERTSIEHTRIHTASNKVRGCGAKLSSGRLFVALQSGPVSALFCYISSILCFICSNVCLCVCLFK